MAIPIRSTLIKKQMSDLHEDAVLTLYTESTVDAYGDETYVEESYNVEVVKSLVTNTRMPFVRSGELGTYYMVQVEFFILTPTEFTIPNNAVNKPPTLLHEGLEYECTEIEHSKIGLSRLIGYRERL